MLTQLVALCTLWCVRDQIYHRLSPWLADICMIQTGSLEAVKWILRYIKGTIDVGLVFEKDSTGKQECIGYVDSDYAGDLDKRRSTTGYVFTFSQALVSWRSTLQSTVALSTAEAEYMAMTEAMKEAIWLQGLLDDLSWNRIC